MVKKNVLILSFSQVHKDPRILRQVRWLRSMGIQHITIVGSGECPPNVDSFLPVQVKPTLKRYVGYLIRNPRRRFSYFYGSELAELENQIVKPDLIVVNEVEFLGWKYLFDDSISNLPTYLDLHEDHINDAHSNFAESFAFRKYWGWQTENLIRFASSRTGPLFVTSVEGEIARTYSRALGRDVAVIMNAPDYTQLKPKQISTNEIKMVHHGIGTRNRGIETSIKVLRKLPAHYSLTLILIQHWSYRIKVELLSRLYGVRSRVIIRPGVSLDRLPYELNHFDVAMVLQSDATVNHLNSLPNKLFESIQGRLAIICGPNPAIKSIVEHYDIGKASPSWTERDVRTTLQSLHIKELARFKENSDKAALELSSSESERVFKEGCSTLLGL